MSLKTGIRIDWRTILVMIYSHILCRNTEKNGRQIIALSGVESEVLDFIYFHEHGAIKAKLFLNRLAKTNPKAVPQAEREDPRPICAAWWPWHW